LKATYRTTKQDAATNEKTRSLRSTIYILQNGRWRMVFYQGTREAL
jgi:hypothetical protein